MTLPYFSIIVPIFNGAGFIESAVTQLSLQEYKNFELILVNDGSTDDTLSIAKELQSRFDWLHVISHNNCGPGYSRNRGLDFATGEYVLFLDIDDIYSTSLLSEIFKYTANKKYDIIVYSYIEKNIRAGYEHECRYSNLVANSNEEIKDIFQSYFINLKFNNGFTWNRVFNKRFLIDNKILFGKQRIQEDELFNIKAYQSASTMLVSNVPLYTYVIHNNNSIFKYNPHLFEDYCDVHCGIINLCKFWNLSNKELLNYINVRFYNCVEHSIKCVILHNSKMIEPKVSTIINNEFTQKCIEYIKTHFLQKHCHHFNDIVSMKIMRLRIIYTIDNSLMFIKLRIKSLLKYKKLS